MRCEQEMCHNWAGGNSCVRDWMDCPEPDDDSSMDEFDDEDEE